MLLAVACVTTWAAYAQTPDLQSRLASVREPIALTGGKLVGPGSQTVRAGMKDAHFIFIGEDHGLAEIPAFSSALFAEAALLGFHNLFVEIGPLAARRMTRVLAAPDPAAEALDWAKSYPFSLAFYNWRQEFDFLREARRAAGPQFHLIGIDQELMGEAKLILASISVKSPQLAELQSAEQAAYEKAAASGNPNDLFMMTAKLEDLTSFRDALRAGKHNADADAIDSILVSRAIYEQLAKSQVGSNTARGLLMKRQYQALTPRGRSSVPEKAVFKFGAIHMMKGLSTVDNREIGNHVSEIAEGIGKPSLHILIVAAKGSQRRFGGIGRVAVVAPVDQVGPGQSDFPYAKPMFDLAMESQGWSLFDFRDLRDWADGARGLDPRMTKLIFGFDLAVVIPLGTPSDEIR